MNTDCDYIIYDIAQMMKGYVKTAVNGIQEIVEGMKMDYKNSDLVWCANCANATPVEDEDGVIYCSALDYCRLEDDFCGLHEWK